MIENSKQYNITLLWCTPGEDFTTHRYLSDIPPCRWKSVVQVFGSFYWWSKAKFSSAFHFSKTTANELKNQQKLHFARKRLSRKWGTKHGKMNKALRLGCFFKMQKPIGCGITTRKSQLLTDSLPPLRHTHMETENDHYFIHISGMMISHGRNTVHLDMIHYTRVMLGSSGHKETASIYVGRFLYMCQVKKKKKIKKIWASLFWSCCD